MCFFLVTKRKDNRNLKVQNIRRGRKEGRQSQFAKEINARLPPSAATQLREEVALLVGGGALNIFCCFFLTALCFRWRYFVVRASVLGAAWQMGKESIAVVIKHTRLFFVLLLSFSILCFMQKKNNCINIVTLLPAKNTFFKGFQFVLSSSFWHRNKLLIKLLVTKISQGICKFFFIKQKFDDKCEIYFVHWNQKAKECCLLVDFWFEFSVRCPAPQNRKPIKADRPLHQNSPKVLFILVRQINLEKNFGVALFY